MKVGPVLTTLVCSDCPKFHFVNSFSYILLGILFFMFCYFHINSLYFKIKCFSQKIPLKILFLKKSFRVFRIKKKIFPKNNMQPYLDQFTSFSILNENFGFEQNTNQSLWSQINGTILG